MDAREFEAMAKAAVVGYWNEEIIPSGLVESKELIGMENVIIVWESKVLQNNKAMLIVDSFGPQYFEVTYNGDKDEFYVDFYVKKGNMVIPVEREEE
jgi:hypothetical protein